MNCSCSEARTKFYYLLEVCPPSEDRLALANHIKHCSDCRKAMLQELELEKKFREKLKGVKVQISSDLVKNIFDQFTPDSSPEGDVEEAPPEKVGVISCPEAGKSWVDCYQFIADDNIVAVGFHANILDPEKSKIVFEYDGRHKINVYAGVFKPLRKEFVFEELLFLKDSCEWHCLYPDSTNMCDCECHMRSVRDYLSFFKTKTSSQG